MYWVRTFKHFKNSLFLKNISGKIFHVGGLKWREIQWTLKSNFKIRALDLKKTLTLCPFLEARYSARIFNITCNFGNDTGRGSAVTSRRQQRNREHFPRLKPPSEQSPHLPLKMVSARTSCQQTECNANGSLTWVRIISEEMAQSNQFQDYTGQDF